MYLLVTLYFYENRRCDSAEDESDRRDRDLWGILYKPWVGLWVQFGPAYPYLKGALSSPSMASLRSILNPDDSRQASSR